MLKKRFSDTIKIVSIRDESLVSCPTERLRRYVLSRDLAVFTDVISDDDGKSIEPFDLAAAGATVFHARPLAVEYEHLRDFASQIGRWQIFALHVTEIENRDFELAFQDVGGRRALDESVRKSLSPDDVEEVANVILESPGRWGSSLPFSQPVGWRARIESMRIALAVR
jgi:hypothetical protein